MKVKLPFVFNTSAEGNFIEVDITAFEKEIQSSFMRVQAALETTSAPFQQTYTSIAEYKVAIPGGAHINTDETETTHPNPASSDMAEGGLSVISRFKGGVDEEMDAVQYAEDPSQADKPKSPVLSIGIEQSKKVTLKEAKQMVKDLVPLTEEACKVLESSSRITKKEAIAIEKFHSGELRSVDCGIDEDANDFDDNLPHDTTAPKMEEEAATKKTFEIQNPDVLGLNLPPAYPAANVPDYAFNLQKVNKDGTFAGPFKDHAELRDLCESELIRLSGHFNKCVVSFSNYFRSAARGGAMATFKEIPDNCLWMVYSFIISMPQENEFPNYKWRFRGEDRDYSYFLPAFGNFSFSDSDIYKPDYTIWV